ADHGEEGEESEVEDQKRQKGQEVRSGAQEKARSSEEIGKESLCQEGVREEGKGAQAVCGESQYDAASKRDAELGAVACADGYLALGGRRRRVGEQLSSATTVPVARGP